MAFTSHTVKAVKTLPEYQSWSCGVVVITSALHAEGPQFDPGRDQLLLKKQVTSNYLSQCIGPSGPAGPGYGPGVG